MRLVRRVQNCERRYCALAGWLGPTWPLVPWRAKVRNGAGRGHVTTGQYVFEEVNQLCAGELLEPSMVCLHVCGRADRGVLDAGLLDSLNVGCLKCLKLALAAAGRISVGERLAARPR